MADPIDVLASLSVKPEQLAELFWNLDAEEQADFFAALDRVAGVKLCFQMGGVIHELTERAERGDYEGLMGFQTMLSHAQDYASGAASWRAARAKSAITRLASEVGK